MIFQKEPAMKRVSILLAASVVCWVVAGARAGDAAKLPLDNEFLIKVAPCNYAMIKISKMAETQGSPVVKAFAVHLGKNHQTTYDNLADLLKNRKIGVVSGTEPETKAEMKRLGDLKGTDFDREYLKWVIKEHRAAVPIFENEIKLGKDADIRAFAEGNLFTLRKHLQGAEELAKTVGSK